MGLKNLTDITGSRWDRSFKSFTSLCSGCKFYRVIDNKDRCYWGMAFKVMDKTKVLPYCQLIKKPSPRLTMLNKKNELENIS